MSLTLTNSKENHQSHIELSLVKINWEIIQKYCQLCRREKMALRIHFSLATSIINKEGKVHTEKK